MEPRAEQLAGEVQAAWHDEPAAPDEDLALLEWGWGPQAAQTFVGIAPMAVKIDSTGFHAATPLLDLSPRAAKAYLGTYVRALLIDLGRQPPGSPGGGDVLLRAHMITVLTSAPFWDRVQPLLSHVQSGVLADVLGYCVERADDLSLDAGQRDTIRARAARLGAGEASG